MRRVLLAAVAIGLAGCAVGPNYKKPAVVTPPQFRSAPDIPGSIGDSKWPELFQDEKLTVLVNAALEENYDIKIAYARVLEARARYGIARADLFPTLSASAGFTAQRQSSIGGVTFIPPGTNLAASFTQVGFNLNWEVDVWGRLRRLTESARAQYLATEEARNGVKTTLIGDVSTAYFNLREADLELAIAKQTMQVAQRSLQLTTARRDLGVATTLDVRQSEQLLYSATATIAAAERLIEQDENLLSFLIAKNPQAIERGKLLTDFKTPPVIPPGLPSTLLERRPDVRQAEDMLIAANANIGAAKAEYFPQITLTGLLGAQSRQLTNLFTAPGRNWSIAPNATLPLFNAGRIRSNVRLTEAEQLEALTTYQKTIQMAFREVSDALIGYKKLAEQRAQEELLVQALRDTDRLSNVRYRGGLDSYLQVLDAQRNLFNGELDLARLRRDELVSIVSLYRALGGGWQ
jgi:NodT family efflux transporter outer membrane factor (OMF) lipoprotein